MAELDGTGLVVDAGGARALGGHPQVRARVADLTERGVGLSFDETVDRFIGTSLAVCLARVGELLGGAPPADFRAEFAQRTQAAFAAGLSTVPGVERVLDALAMPYCVASNGNRAKVDFTLGHTGLLPRFAGRIFTADDVQHPKPAPDLFLFAARSMGTEPARTTVVEDTPTGVRVTGTTSSRPYFSTYSSSTS